MDKSRGFDMGLMVGVPCRRRLDMGLMVGIPGRRRLSLGIMRCIPLLDSIYMVSTIVGSRIIKEVLSIDMVSTIVGSWIIKELSSSVIHVVLNLMGTWRPLSYIIHEVLRLC